MSEKSAGKPRGKPFEPGQSGNPAGRPAGVPNKATKEIKEFMRGVLESPEYRTNFEARARSGELAPAIEAMAHAYAYGKPPERVEMTGDLTVAGTYDLGAAPKDLLEKLREILVRLPKSTPES